MLRNSKGLTLVELMVVLTILGVLATMAIPMLGITPRAKLKSAARDIASTFQSLRMNALRDGKNWRVEFDTANKQYKIYELDLTQSTATKEVYILRKTVNLYDNSSRLEFGSGYVPDSGAAVDDGVTFPANRATFKSDGMLVQGGTIYVWDHKSKDTIAISVLFTTGRVHMRTNFGGGWGS